MFTMLGAIKREGDAQGPVGGGQTQNAAGFYGMRAHAFRPLRHARKFCRMVTRFDWGPFGHRP